MQMLSQNGGTYFKPLFHHAPTDAMAYKDIENNFMIGDQIKIGMVTDAVNVTQHDFYFPSGTWCPLFDMDTDCRNIFFYDKDGAVIASKGMYEPLPATADQAHVHIAGGSIVPMVDVVANPIMSVHDMKMQPLDLHVSPMQQG